MKRREEVNVDAEIVKVQAALFDIEHDIKLLTRKRKKTKSVMFFSGEGARLGDPNVARDILGGQLQELNVRKSECEERLKFLLKEKEKKEV